MDKFRNYIIREECEIEPLNKWIITEEQNGMSTLVEWRVTF
jgi:hypothetical protein